MEKLKKNGFIKSAVIVSAGGFIAKLIGALYRIPLTNIIGGHGIGLYQMVYPVYCLLLTVSATGIPSSIAKLTAERIQKGESDRAVLRTAMKLFVCIGAVGTALMCGIAPFLSRAQNSEEIVFGYFALAPSVLLVSAISVYRGWFQGKNEMFPTASSEVIEQVVKVSVGLVLAYVFRENITFSVTVLLLAVTVSEAVALVWMRILFSRRVRGKKAGKDGGRVEMKQVLRLSIPVTFSAILLPLSGIIDSVLAVRMLSAYTEDAVALYGLFSGGAVTIVNLPVSVCYGVAAASVPAVASACATGDCGQVRKKLVFALLITLAVSVPSALGLFVFAQPVVKIIFRSLAGQELQTLTALVKLFSISCITLSCTQTLSACLTAQGKPKYSAYAMTIAVALKTIVYTILLPHAEISVFGLAHATNACYLVAFSLDLVYNLFVSKRIRRKKS